MWIKPAALRRQGMLGMNRRNLEFIGRYNSRASYPLVDDKLRTRRLAEQYGIASPRLISVLRTQHDARAFVRSPDSPARFVIKPGRGAGGKGIMVIQGRSDGDFLKASGEQLSRTDLERDLSNILAGLYSLSGQPDVALVEDVIEPGPDFTAWSHEGVPDVRILLFQGYPVMAMVRLSTHRSDGKANLHKGAVGVGLDIASGRCRHAVQFNHRVFHHPDTGHALNNLSVPDWHPLLMQAAWCYEATGLGYLGVDLVIDEHQGPLLLELNARPGLAIQIANGQGLLPRLRHIETLSGPHLTPRDRVDHVIEQFAASGLSNGGNTHPPHA